MKIKRFSIFKRISILVFTLITILCLLFMGLTYYSTTNFHEASTQLLNKDVAAHIASKQKILFTLSPLQPMPFELFYQRI